MSFLDRKDAKRIFDLPPSTQILIDMKPRRCNSDVYINQKMDVTELVKYVEKKKKEGSKITYFHAFTMAFGILLYNRPKLNRFVANRHIYEHNDVSISFAAKVSFDDKSEEIMEVVPIYKEDTINNISARIMDMVEGTRTGNSSKSGANDAIVTLAKLPNILRVPIFGVINFCDKHGILPNSLMKDNLYYSSLIVSNLGSIKCGAIYHNIINFGSCSGLASMGEIKDCEVINENGKKEIRKLCEFGITLDERIADGYYFAKSIKLLQYIFDNPELLEKRADSKLDVEEMR